MDNSQNTSNNFSQKSKPEVVFKFKDGFYIAKLNAEHLSEEAQVMQNCVGGDRICDLVQNNKVNLYALKDPNGNSHVHIEVLPSNTLVELKGKQNDIPSKKYASYIKEWIKSESINAEFNKDYLSLFKDDELVKMFEETGNDYAYAYAAKWASDPELKNRFIKDVVNNYENGFDNFNFKNIGTIGGNVHLTEKEQKLLLDNGNISVILNLARNLYVDEVIIDEIIKKHLLKVNNSNSAFAKELIIALTENDNAVLKYKKLLIKLAHDLSVGKAFLNLSFISPRLLESEVKQILDYSINNPNEYDDISETIARLSNHTNILKDLYKYFVSKRNLKGLLSLASNHFLNDEIILTLIMLNNTKVDDNLFENPTVGTSIKQMLEKRRNK